MPDMTLTLQLQSWASEIWPRERSELLPLLDDIFKPSNLKCFLIVTTLIWLSGDMPSSPASDFNILCAFGHVIFRTSVSPLITWKIWTSLSLKPSQKPDMLNFCDSSWFHLLLWYLSEICWWRTHSQDYWMNK